MSEIVGLRTSQVDVDRRIVRLIHTKNTQARTVPLSIAAAEVFRQALAHPVRPADTDLIFFGEPRRDGSRGPYSFDGVWQEIKRAQGIKDLRFHDL